MSYILFYALGLGLCRVLYVEEHNFGNYLHTYVLVTYKFYRMLLIAATTFQNNYIKENFDRIYKEEQMQLFACVCAYSNLFSSVHSIRSTKNINCSQFNPYYLGQLLYKNVVISDKLYQILFRATIFEFLLKTYVYPLTIKNCD